MKHEYEDYLRDMLENAEKALFLYREWNMIVFAPMIKLCMP
jgi:hypothetical protein